MKKKNKNRNAAERLAEAFAIIEECKNVMPAETYNRIGDCLIDWINEAHWVEDPKMLRLTLPNIFRKLIEQNGA